MMPIYEVLNFRFNADVNVTGDYEDISVPLKESLILDWACVLEMPGCVSFARDQYKEWMDKYDVSEPDKPM
jgi:hypothetical protein